MNPIGNRNPNLQVPQSPDLNKTTQELREDQAKMQQGTVAQSGATVQPAFPTPVTETTQKPQGMPEMPPNLANLLGGAGGGSSIQDKKASNAMADISNVLKLNLAKMLEDVTQKSNLSQEGIRLFLKDLQISSTSPASIDATITCNIPKGKRVFVESVLHSVYTSVLDILTQYIDENDQDYKASAGLSKEKQEELEGKIAQLIQQTSCKSPIKEIIFFKNNKPILSFPPNSGMSKEEVEAVSATVQSWMTGYKTYGIVFTAQIEIIEEETPSKDGEASMKLQARRTKLEEQMRHEQSQKENKEAQKEQNITNPSQKTQKEEKDTTTERSQEHIQSTSESTKTKEESQSSDTSEKKESPVSNSPEMSTSFIPIPKQEPQKKLAGILKNKGNVEIPQLKPVKKSIRFKEPEEQKSEEQKKEETPSQSPVDFNNFLQLFNQLSQQSNPMNQAQRRTPNQAEESNYSQNQDRAHPNNPYEDA